ncbi:MAG: family N-acetyltransferase [Marmoricola sp.]|nr:family N-acetyltransferase [Marmoricola sp.]
MQVAEYDADDADEVEAGRLVLNAAHATDAPWMPGLTPHRRRMQVRHGWDGGPVRHLVAWADGEPLALAEIELGEWDNRDLAWIQLVVHPRHRRQGYGSAFLAEIFRLARDVGCTKIGGSGWETPATEAFAREHGFVRASQEIYRVATLADMPTGLGDAAYAEAAPHAAAYELIRLRGRAPLDLLPAVAQLTAAINDAPIDDLDIEDEAFPTERIRNYENSTIRSGHRLYRIVARHRGTGELGGHTIVAVDEESPRLGHQHDTSVARAHRGHRLGLVLKADMLRWLAEVEPQVLTIDTWNGESNDHMIGINERLGYRALGRDLAYQRKL